MEPQPERRDDLAVTSIRELICLAKEGGQRQKNEQIKDAHSGKEIRRNGNTSELWRYQLKGKGEDTLCRLYVTVRRRWSKGNYII